MRRTTLLSSRLEALLSTLIFVLALAMTCFVSPRPASAAPAGDRNATGSGSGQLHLMKTHKAAPTNAASNPVTYHGSQVMQKTSTTYAIFWEPSTLPDGTATHVSANYNSLIERYFGDIGGSKLYNSNTQYYDNFTGHVTNSSTFGGAWVDTAAYPASDCSDSATPNNCLNDADIQAEVTRAMSTNGWTGSLTHMFFVFTSYGGGSCTDSTSAKCAFTQYCAYHANLNGNVLYANIPYAATSLADCGVPKSPNNDMDADSAINVVSHQHMGGVTDPVGNAWYDNSNFEIGDKCDFVFGPFNLDGGLADAQWNGHYYIVQEEWSNALGACTMSTTGSLLKATVYVRSSLASQIYALNAMDGTMRWNYTTFGSVDSSPFVVNGIVYVGGDPHNFYALDASGGFLRWGVALDTSDQSPNVVNGICYIGSDDNKVYALNASNGSQRWSFATGNKVESTPAVSNGLLYVGSDDHNVYALNARNGALLWSYQTGDVVVSSPAVVNGIVYVGGNDSKIYALNASNGTLLWSYQTGGTVDSSPTIVNGVVYIGSTDRILYALNAGNGSLKWTFLGPAQIAGTPRVIGGVVFFGDNGGTSWALNASNGSPQWAYLTGTYGSSSPAVSTVGY